MSDFAHGSSVSSLAWLTSWVIQQPCSAEQLIDLLYFNSLRPSAV
jgi:hypothetical protein